MPPIPDHSRRARAATPRALAVARATVQLARAGHTDAASRADLLVSIDGARSRVGLPMRDALHAWDLPSVDVDRLSTASLATLLAEARGQWRARRAA